MRRGTSPGIALQAIELDGLSGCVVLCRSVSATGGSRNGSLRPAAEARSRSAATAGNPAERSRARPLGDRGPAAGVCGDSCAIMDGLAARVPGCPRIWPAWVCQSTMSGDSAAWWNKPAPLAGRPGHSMASGSCAAARLRPRRGSARALCPPSPPAGVRHRRTGRQARPRGAASHWSGRAFRSVRSTG
jgi:hypothetical protein